MHSLEVIPNYFIVYRLLLLLEVTHDAFDLFFQYTLWRGDDLHAHDRFFLPSCLRRCERLFLLLKLELFGTETDSHSYGDHNCQGDAVVCDHQASTFRARFVYCVCVCSCEWPTSVQFIQQKWSNRCEENKIVNCDFVKHLKSCTITFDIGYYYFHCIML